MAAAAYRDRLHKSATYALHRLLLISAKRFSSIQQIRNGYAGFPAVRPASRQSLAFLRRSILGRSNSAQNSSALFFGSPPQRLEPRVAVQQMIARIGFHFADIEAAVFSPYEERVDRVRRFRPIWRSFRGARPDFGCTRLPSIPGERSGRWRSWACSGSTSRRRDPDH